MFMIVGLVWLLGSTQGSGGCDSGCSGCEAAPRPPQNDATFCDITAIPCAAWNATTGRCAAPDCANLPNACSTDPIDFVTTCNPAATSCRRILATPTSGARICFDHTQITADQACQNGCTNLPTLHKFNLAFDLFPLALVLNQGCEGHANLGTNHAQYTAASIPGGANDYIANGCINDGPAIEGVHPYTHGVSLMGGGSVQSTGNGIPPKPLAIRGGHFHLSAPNTSCNVLQTDCPVNVTGMELLFDDIEGDTGSIGGGGVHAMRNGGMWLNDPFLTPSGTFFPASGNLPATFSFPMPPGIVFDAIGVGDGFLIGTTAASNVELSATIFLDTGRLTYDFDIRETVGGSLAELVGTATTNQVLALAPVLTAPAPAPVNATGSCTANVTLTATASSPLGFPVTIDYTVDSTASALGAGGSATFPVTVGTHAAAVVATDNNGGLTRVEHVITVNDATGPVFDPPVPPSQTVQTCSNGNTTVRVTVPTAHGQCAAGAATVTGTVIERNGVPVSIPINNGNVTIGPGSAVIRWVATGANGQTTPVTQTLVVNGPATYYGSRGVNLADRSTVNGTVYSGAGGVASVGNDSLINGSIISLSPVQLRDRVRVTLIHTSAGLTRGNNDVVTTFVTTTPTLPAFPAINQSFTGTQAITVAPDTTRTLAPGQYGAVTVFSRARLVLSAGSYVFTSLDLEPQATLVVPSSTTQNVQVFARDNVIYRGRTATASGTLAPLYLGYTGANGITIESVYTGTIVAPNATLTMQSLPPPRGRRPLRMPDRQPIDRGSPPARRRLRRLCDLGALAASMSMSLSISLSCKADGGGPFVGFVSRSAYFEYHNRVDEPLCPTLLSLLDEHALRVGGKIGLVPDPARPFRYYKFRDLADFRSNSGCGLDGGGCAPGDSTYSTLFFDPHELSHNYVNRAWSGGSTGLLNEGEAVALSCQPGYSAQPGERPGQVLGNPDWRDLLMLHGNSIPGYAAAGFWVTNLAAQFGWDRVRALHRRIRAGTAAPDFEREFARVFPISMDATWSQALDTPGAPACEDDWGCTAIPLDVGGRAAPDCDGQLHRSITVVDRPGVVLTLSGAGSEIFLRDCAAAAAPIYELGAGATARTTHAAVLPPGTYTLFGAPPPSEVELVAHLPPGFNADACAAAAAITLDPAQATHVDLLAGRANGWAGLAGGGHRYVAQPVNLLWPGWPGPSGAPAVCDSCAAGAACVPLPAGEVTSVTIPDGAVLRLTGVSALASSSLYGQVLFQPQAPGGAAP